MAGELCNVSRDWDAPIAAGEFTDDVNPYAAKRMFQAILGLAIEDARAELPALPVGSAPEGWRPSARSLREKDEAWVGFVDGRIAKRKEAEKHREQARKLLFGGGPYFRQLCELAGFDEEYVSEKIAALPTSKDNEPCSVAI